MQQLPEAEQLRPTTANAVTESTRGASAIGSVYLMDSERLRMWSPDVFLISMFLFAFVIDIDACIHSVLSSSVLSYFLQILPDVAVLD